MRRLARAAIPIAFLAAVSAAGGTRVLADTPEASRLDALESRIRDMQRLYEARIAALEKEVAELKGVPLAVSPPAPAAPAPSAAEVRPAPATPSAAPGTTPSSDLEAQLARELAGTPAPPGAATPTPPSPAPWSPAQPITLAGGGKNYLNLSFDTLVAAGTSTSPDVESLQSGGHDPSQRGFTAQNVEMVLEGAVDPYFLGQGNVVLQIGPDGETNVELEEAYLVSTSLPANLQVKAGMYFTEFGRLNAQH